MTSAARLEKAKTVLPRNSRAWKMGWAMRVSQRMKSGNAAAASSSIAAPRRAGSQVKPSMKAVSITL